MARGSTHPLIEFVCETFGEFFGHMLLAGFGEESPPKKRVFYFTEQFDAGEIDWVINVVSDCPLRGQEPLVLASLLKLLTKQFPAGQPFDFRIKDLLDEMGWPNTRGQQKIVDRVIEKCAALTFHKFEKRKKERYKKVNAQWGRYKFVTGYRIETIRPAGEPEITRERNRVDFDTRFIRGLNEGKVFFVDINFGPLGSDN